MESLSMDKKKLQKMLFLLNALENGWCVKKIGENYIFKKKHENKTEVFQSDYLDTFIASNMKL